MINRKHNYFYKITNLVNGKYYYGIRSTDKEPHVDIYYLGSGMVIKEAIKKYGKTNFSKEIIVDYPTRREASNHEKMVVTFELIELEECYNLRTGGDNEYTFKHSSDTKIRISQSTKGKKLSDETKLKIGEASKQRRCSEQTRIRLSEGNKGKKRSEEFRKNVSSVHKGRRNSEDVKRKMSKAKYVKCIIDDVVYNSRLEAGELLKVHYITVIRRIKSENSKWINWKNYEEK